MSLWVLVSIFWLWTYDLYCYLCGRFIFIVLKKLCYLQWIHHLTFAPRGNRVTVSLQLFKIFNVFFFFQRNHSSSFKWYLIVVSISKSIIKVVEHLPKFLPVLLCFLFKVNFNDLSSLSLIFTSLYTFST